MKETKSPLLEGVNNDLPTSDLLESSIISFNGDSSNDSETVGSENTVESIDFSDMMKISQSPEPKKKSKTPPPPLLVKKRRTQREPNFQRTLRKPCFLASPILQKKSVSKRDMTPLQISPCHSGDIMVVDKALGSPTKKPVATPPQHLDLAKRPSNCGNHLAPTPRTPDRGNRLAAPQKEVECLSPNTLFHKPMETLVGEIQKLMCDVGAPPPNINRSRKRGRVNPKVAFGIKKKVALEKKQKRMVQPSSETKKQRRESEVATPPQYDQRNRGDLPPMKNYSRKNKKTNNSNRSVSSENAVQAEKKTKKILPEKQKSRQNTPEKQMKKITPETRMTRKYSTEKKKMWEKTPEVMQIEKARKISAQKKRAREMTPELMQLDKEDAKATSSADNSRKRKRTPTVRKYNFRFKRKKLNSPLPSKIEILPRMRTPL